MHTLVLYSRVVYYELVAYIIIIIMDTLATQVVLASSICPERGLINALACRGSKPLPKPSLQPAAEQLAHLAAGEPFRTDPIPNTRNNQSPAWLLLASSGSWLRPSCSSFRPARRAPSPCRRGHRQPTRGPPTSPPTSPLPRLLPGGGSPRRGGSP